MHYKDTEKLRLRPNIYGVKIRQKNTGTLCTGIYIHIDRESRLGQESQQYTSSNGRSDYTCNVGAHGMHQQIVGRIVFQPDVL